MTSLIQLLPVVYPVGVKDLQPFYAKISHSSVNLYQPKLVQICALMSLHVYQFELNQSMHSHFMAENAKCVKTEREKNPENLKQNFAH